MIRISQYSVEAPTREGQTAKSLIEAMVDEFYVVRTKQAGELLRKG